MATMNGTGPRRRSARRGYWQGQVEAQRRSGLSRALFCARRGLRPSTFSFWKWKLAHAARPGPGVAGPKRSVPTPAFVPVRVTSGPVPLGAAAGRLAPDGEVVIVLGRARRVRVRGRVDPTWLVQVLRGLEARGC